MLVASASSVCRAVRQHVPSRPVETWLGKVKSLAVPFSPDFNFSTFLAKMTDVRDWRIQGLPADEFSTENGVIVKRCDRWPPMVDPQGQANKWVKNMEGHSSRWPIRRARISSASSRMRSSSACRTSCRTSKKSLTRRLSSSWQQPADGNRQVIKLGDKELDWSKDFIFTSRRSSEPALPPGSLDEDDDTNFAVKEQGLQAQLLGIVVHMEEPILETKSQS